MKVTPLSIPDVLLIEPLVFEDNRGFFLKVLERILFKKKYHSELILFKITIQSHLEV